MVSIHNPVAKYMNKICKPFYVPSKRQKLKDIAELKEWLKSVSDAEIGTRKAILSEDIEEDE